MFARTNVRRLEPVIVTFAAIHGMRWAFLIIGGVLGLTTVRARAGGETVAEALFRDARREMKAGNLTAACAKFAESQRLDPSLGTLLNLALCEEKAGRLASAWTKYQEVLDAMAPSDERRKLALERIAALEAQLPRLRITTRGHATAELDGIELGAPSLGVDLPVDPGRHLVVFKRKGQTSTREVVLERGGRALVELGPGELPEPSKPQTKPRVLQREQLRPRTTSAVSSDPKRGTGTRAPNGAVSDLRRSGFVAAGAGLGALATAGVLTAVALHQRALARQQCPDRVCSPEGFAALDESGDLFRMADAALVVGVIGVAVGGLLIFESTRARVGMTVARGSATAHVAGTLP
jgi:hypothetical protein